MNLPKSTGSNDLPKRDKSIILNDLPDKTNESFKTKIIWVAGFIMVILLVSSMLNLSKIKTPFLEAEFSNKSAIAEQPKQASSSVQTNEVDNINPQALKSQPTQDSAIKKPLHCENATKFSSLQRIKTEVLFSYPGRIDASIRYEDDIAFDGFCGFVEFTLKDNVGNIITTYKSNNECIDSNKTKVKIIHYTQPVEQEIANKVFSIEAKAYNK